jgi:tetratricopeptide (TPR) repeat protein
VVIEPFRAPPGLAARGIDGSVIASGLLDELSRLQDATRSSASGYALSGAWAENIKLEVTDTGISLTDLSRLLRQRFGHDVHIEGELIETLAGGLTLTVRGNGVPPKKFGGAATELDKLTVAAAEYVYSMSQPARWAAYLVEVGRNQEAIDFCSAAYAAADLSTRVDLLNTWANALENVGGSLREALNLYQQAAKLNPDSWRSYANLMNTYMLLGEEQEAWRTGVNMRRAAGGRPGNAPETSYSNWDLLTFNLEPWLQSSLADAAANAGAGTLLGTAALGIADIYMRMHDPGAAELTLKTMKEDPSDPMIGAISHFVRGRLAADAGDNARASTEMKAFAIAFADPAVSSNYPGYQCWIAPAEEAAGHPEKADAVLQAAGSYVDCYRFHADILDGRGDWAGAQQAYAKAVALAPDLPAAYLSWGLALERHGDLAAAAQKLKDSSTRGPNWADPLKAWGDVLLKQGERKSALAKYDEALKRAPNWEALKEAAARARRGG